MNQAKNNSNNSPQNLLGKKTIYPQNYSPQLLFALERAPARSQLPLYNQGQLTFMGEDVWTLYEVSWLNGHGIPQVAIGELRLPAASDFIIESKSLKLYLNSLNQHRFASWQQALKTIQADIEQKLGHKVGLQLFSLASFKGQMLHQPPGINIDPALHKISANKIKAVNPSFLTVDKSQQLAEVLYSDLLKSNCQITCQPDWATIIIDYKGAKLDRAGLLKYILSYRQINEFHEPCVERIYHDIMHYCRPKKLAVYARYTRRGGIEINPFRSNYPISPLNLRLIRQ